MNFFHAIIVWCCILCVSPLAKAEEDPDFLRGSALYQHGKGKSADYPEALRHFMKAAEKGHARSQFYVGRMYHLESSVGIDLNAAKKWYRLAGEKGEEMAWNNLGNIYRNLGGPDHFTVECYNRASQLGEVQSHFSLGQGYRFGRYGLPIDPDKAMMHLQKAAEGGHARASAIAGKIYSDGWRSVKPDKLKAAYCFSLGAKVGNGWDMCLLGELLQDREVQHRADAATLQGWRDLWQNYRKQVEQDVKPVLAKSRVAYDGGNPKAARQILAEAMERWMSLTVDSCDYQHCCVIWVEAQLRGGRTDLVWSHFLYSYLCDHRERQKDEGLLATRSNMEECLVGLGQFGLLRQSLEVTKRLMLQDEKIDVDAVLAGVKVGSDYQILGAEKLPLFVSRGDEERGIASGDFIGGSAMNGLDSLAHERLAVGDWVSALIIAEWWQRWSDAFRKAGVTPERSFLGFKGEFAQMPMGLRMEAFSALGLPEREAEAARQIVALNSNSYGGRKLHAAQLRLFDLAVNQGRSHEIDLKELESLEEKIRLNIYAEGHSWKFAKLVRAKVIAKSRGLDEGLPLVREVLDETKDDVLGPLRLEALLVAAQLSLEAGVTDGVAVILSEALESSRSRGLLVKEMRVYELYVDYLLATHQYEAAIEMQNRVIQLIKALKLAPRLEGALSRLEEIVSLQQKNLAAAPSGGQTGGESLPRPTETPREGQGRKTDNDSPSLPHPGRPKTSLTLQPKGIRTLPIGKEASSVFLLSNLSTRPTKAILKLKSDQFRFTLDEQQEGQVTVVCKLLDQAGVQELDCKVDAPGGGQIPIVLIAEGIASTAEGTVAISLLGDSAGSSAEQDSQWIIQQKSEAGIIAIVDAARLTDSNFSLVPVFHHLGSTEAGRIAALRVIASEPTRVEGFAADGTLLFVDAEGNGSFGDAGDLIATEKMDDLHPVLKSNPDSGRIALRYRPHAKALSKQMEIRIETREFGKGGAWRLDAIDLLEP